MAPRTYGSQSSRAQGGRRPRQETPEEQEEEEAGSDVVGADEADGDARETQETQGGTSGMGGLSREEVQRKAAQLARYALMQEYKRQIVRKSDVTKRILPGSSRAFPAVLAGAQAILRQKFGMEMYEVKGRAKGDDAANGETQATQTQSQTQAAQGRKRKGKGRARLDDIEEEEEDDEEEAVGGGSGAKKQKKNSTNTWFLRSILPPPVIEAMSTAKALPLFPANGHVNGHSNGHTSGAADDDGPEDSGALQRWEKGDGTSIGHISLVGLRTVILTLILVSGRVIQDDHLHSLLRRINLHRETLLPYASPDSKDPPLTVDRFLDQLQKHGYLERQKMKGSAGDDDGPMYEWRWGRRAGEFSEVAAARYIEGVYGALAGLAIAHATRLTASMIEAQQTAEDDEDETGAHGRHRTAEEKRIREARRKLHADLAKAAGSELADD